MCLSMCFLKRSSENFVWIINRFERNSGYFLRLIVVHLLSGKVSDRVCVCVIYCSADAVVVVVVVFNLFLFI